MVIRGLNGVDLDMLVIGAIKELKAENDAQNREIRELKTQNELLKQAVCELNPVAEICH